MSTTFDAVVIGMGQAGPSLAARLCAHGMKVAIVERDQFGGTCVNNGCTPTKAMVASAYAAHLATRAAQYGVVLPGSPTVSMKRVKSRTEEIVRNAREGVESWMAGLKSATIYRGQARFSGPRSVEVSGEVLTADKIFINVGGRPLIPRMPGLDAVPYLTSVSMMDLDFVPEHLLVIGGSYVGLEFAQIFRRFGSRVTVVEMGPRLVGHEDEDVSRCIEDFLSGEGIALRLGAQCVSMHSAVDGLSVGLDCKEGAPREAGSHVLLAVAARQIQTTSVWARRRSRLTRTVTSRWTKGFSRQIHTSGLSVTATAKAPSRIRHITITRLLPTTCSQARRANTLIGHRFMLSLRTRRWDE